MPLFKFQLFYSNLCFLIFFFEISIASLWCSQLINKKCNMLVFTLICTGHFIFFWRKRKYVALWSRPLLHATQILLGAICHSVQWNSILQLGKLPQEKKYFMRSLMYIFMLSLILERNQRWLQNFSCFLNFILHLCFAFWLIPASEIFPSVG